MKRTKENAQETRDNILNAAADVFSHHGVAKSTLDQIAKKASVTRGAIYWHFKNKNEIYDALHERLHNPLMAMLMEKMEEEHQDPILHLRDICINLLLDLEKDKQKRQALSLFLIKADYSGDLAIYKDKHYKKKQEGRAAFKQYFDKAKVQGRLPENTDTSFLTVSIQCYMKGILLEYFNNLEDFDIKKQAPRLINLFFGNFTKHA